MRERANAKVIHPDRGPPLSVLSVPGLGGGSGKLSAVEQKTKLSTTSPSHDAHPRSWGLETRVGLVEAGFPRETPTPQGLRREVLTPWGEKRCLP